MISQKILDQIITRIVDTANPTRIILFGSAVKDKMGPNSDFDILVVMPPGSHRRNTARAIYRNLVGVGFAVDVVVVTEEDIQRYGDHTGFVIKPALEEGKILYAA